MNLSLFFSFFNPCIDVGEGHRKREERGRKEVNPTNLKTSKNTWKASPNNTTVLHHSFSRLTLFYLQLKIKTMSSPADQESSQHGKPSEFMSCLVTMEDITEENYGALNDT